MMISRADSLVYILFFLMKTSKSSSTDLDCGPNVQVPCSINITGPVLDDYRWKVPVCTHTFTEIGVIGLKYEKPPESLKKLRQFEIRIFMNKEFLKQVLINNSNTQMNCRFENLEPADYRIKIRPINPNKECVCLQGTMCKTCKARTVDVTLERSKVLKTTYHAGHTNAYDDRTKPVSSTGQTTYSTRHIPVVTGKYADSSNYTPTKGQGDHDTAEIVPDRQNTDQNVFPGYTESFHDSLPHYQETLHGWQEMLLVLLAILILLVISTFVSLCVVYFRQRRRISANQNERFSNHSVESVSETRRLSSAEIDGQGVYSSMCQKMDVIRNSPTCQKMDVTRNRIEEDDHFHEVRDSGFYNRDDDSDVMPDTGDGSVLGDKLLTNCDSICDLSNGAFIADSLVWADMDKDMSTNVRATYPWYSEKVDGQSSQKHLICGKNSTQANPTSHHPPIAKLKKDMGHDQNSQCNSKSKIGTRLAWKASTLTLMSHKTNYIHAKTNNSEHSGLLQAVEIVVSKNEDKYPVTFPLNFAESAETINVCGEDEWKFSEYVAPSNSAYSNRGYNTKYTHNKDNNDAISLGEISI